MSDLFYIIAVMVNNDHTNKGDEMKPQIISVFRKARTFYSKNPNAPQETKTVTSDGEIVATIQVPLWGDLKSPDSSLLIKALYGATSPSEVAHHGALLIGRRIKDDLANQERANAKRGRSLPKLVQGKIDEAFEAKDVKTLIRHRKYLSTDLDYTDNELADLDSQIKQLA